MKVKQLIKFFCIMVPAILSCTENTGSSKDDKVTIASLIQGSEITVSAAGTTISIPFSSVVSTR